VFSLGAGWHLGIPIGSVTDFTDNVSGVGFDLLFKYWVHPRVTVGGGFDWQTFTDSRPRTTYQIENGAVTATAYNSVQLGNLRAGADFYLMDRGHLLPYLGAQVGFQWSTLQTIAADVALYDNQESVVVGGELGTLIAMDERSPFLMLAANYSYAPAVEFLNAVDDVQSISIRLGVLSR
jgi:hypothetical protein